MKREAKLKVTEVYKSQDESVRNEALKRKIIKLIKNLENPDK